MTTHHAPHLDDTCRALLAAVLAGECPAAVLADALADRGDVREAAVRAAPLRRDVPADVQALGVALFKRRTGRRPAAGLTGPLIYQCLVQARRLLWDGRVRLLPSAAEADELRSLFRRRLAEALGGGRVADGAAVMARAEGYPTPGEAAARLVREDGR